MKKEWITSSDPIMSLIRWPAGTCSALISRTPSGCCTFHIHCLPTTLIVIAFSAGRLILAYNSAPQKNITSMSMNGMMHQVISSFVL